MSKRSVIALLVACAAPAHAFVPAGRRSLPHTAAAGVERHELALTAVRRSVQPQMAAAAVATRLGAGGLLATLTRPVVAVAATLLVVIAWAFKRLNTPSRVYDREANSVGREYDAWTSEGVLEYYWGEHIHLGWYAEGQRKGPFYGGKDFIEATVTDFTEKMLEFSKAESPAKVLDVGCGIGGTSRYLAKRFPEAEVTGITISQEQQRRATALATERGISNAKFELVDALNMSYPDNSFDLVWGCESGEHMPDKEKYADTRESDESPLEPEEESHGVTVVVVGPGVTTTVMVVPSALARANNEAINMACIARTSALCRKPRNLSLELEP